MGRDYPELFQSRSFIEGVVENEEQRFADTLSYAMHVVNEEIGKLKAAGEDTIPGQLAFKLYDTYGFSLDLLEDVAREENLRVDTAGYESAMSHQRRQSQKSWRGSGQDEVPEIYRTLLLRGVNSGFAGYQNLRTTSRVTALLVAGQEVDSARTGEKIEVVLDETPFYGRAGGQVGDTGWLNCGNSRVRVSDTAKIDEKLIVHKGELETGTLRVGDQVEAGVDEAKRKATARNHSATHLLHTALREVLGEHVKQAGSLVAPERLRFDFSHFTQVSADTLFEVERLVNSYVRQNLAVETQEMSKEKAFQTGAMAIFEERYGDTVRLVSMGDGISRELCGGTHTERTGDIGLFRILGEGAVAANIRRIEAITGETALQHDQKQDQDLRFAAGLLKTTSDQVRERLPRLLEELKKKDREISALQTKMLSKKAEDVLSKVQEIAGIQVLVLEIDAESPKELRESADRLKDRLGSGIVLVGAKTKNKAMLTCGVTKDLTARFKAGEIIKRLSPIVGGKGGGRPDMAQGGGGKPERLAEALAGISSLIEKRAE
jgi:alanyl-tRNA synthetase